jgi:hypothetical protein
MVLIVRSDPIIRHVDEILTFPLTEEQAATSQVTSPQPQTTETSNGSL